MLKAEYLSKNEVHISQWILYKMFRFLFAVMPIQIHKVQVGVLYGYGAHVCS